MSVYVLCIYTMFKTGAHEGQKRQLDPLEVELQLLVSCHMGAENCVQVF